jgi:glucose/mannose-6-phosphate isomerase
MLPLIEGFTQQLSHAMQIGGAAQTTGHSCAITHVVVAGLGGSGIGANWVETIVRDHLQVPFTVIKEYDIPAYIGENTLFIACSFSGNTEETLESLEKAMQSGAKIAAVTSGGKLLDIVKTHSLDHVVIPGESNCPRANLGYSFIQQLYLLRHYNLLHVAFEYDIEEAISLLDKKSSEIKEEAKRLALLLKGKLPILYADSKFLPLIVRIQQQINENGKQLCHVNVFPEMNHNELVGFKYPVDILHNSVVLFFDSPFNNARVGYRWSLCASIFSKYCPEVHTLTPLGKGMLTQMLYWNNLFDWVSFYLAAENGEDPFTIEVIQYLKAELTKK